MKILEYIHRALLNPKETGIKRLEEIRKKIEKKKNKKGGKK